MRKSLIAALISILSFSAVPLSASAFLQVKLDQWDVKYKKSDFVFSHQVGGTPVLSLKSKDFNSVFMAKQSAPQSIRSVKKRIQELNGDIKSLKILKHKNVTVFRFETKEDYHWYTTRGGHLILNLSNKKGGDKKSLIEGVTWASR